MLLLIVYFFVRSEVPEGVMFLLLKLNMLSYFKSAGERARLRQRFLFSTNASGWSFME